jgi:hypothetical protein
MNVIEQPRDHVRNRWFLRYADEIDPEELEVLQLVDSFKGLLRQNAAVAWTQLVEKTGRPRAELHEILNRLAGQQVLETEGYMGLLAPKQDPAPYRARLTNKGNDFLLYLRGREGS